MSQPRATPIDAIEQQPPNQQNIDVLNKVMANIGGGGRGAPPKAPPPPPTQPSQSTYRPPQPPMPAYNIPKQAPQREYMQGPPAPPFQGRPPSTNGVSYIGGGAPPQSSYSMFSFASILAAFKEHIIIGILITVMGMPSIRSTLLSIVPQAIGLDGQTPTLYGYIILIIAGSVASAVLKMAGHV
jgi:hypothetical protein